MNPRFIIDVGGPDGGRFARRAARIGCAFVVTLALGLTGCGSDDSQAEQRGGGQGARGGGGGDRRGGGGGPGGGGFPGMADGERMTAVPVEVQTVTLRSISSYIQTNGTLEAESEVDIVARSAGPIIEMTAEEGQSVRQGQLLARIDSEALVAQQDLTRVELNEARIAFERAERLRQGELLSEAEYETTAARFETAKAQVEGNRIQLAYTEIRAPFDGLIVTRYVKFAENVGVNTPLFRISDFDPLLCPIQVPERELSSLRVGQSAHLTVESWPGTRFEAQVLRLSPVIDAATGTVKVTLEVQGQGKLRPGMFASVFLQKATRDNVPVVPKTALLLDSIGDTVFVVDGAAASRRDVELGFQEGDFVEIASGIQAGEQLIVVGQDGLSDGTPIQVLSAETRGAPAPRQGADAVAGEASGTVTSGDAAARKGPGDRRGGGPGGRPDFANMTPEQLEAAKARMRERGMTDEQIEERLKRLREPQPR